MTSTSRTITGRGVWPCTNNLATDAISWSVANGSRLWPNTATRETSVSSTNASVGFANAELFRSLSPAEIARLERAAHPRHYDSGAVIIKEGEGGIAFFVVTSGKVVITRA